MRVFLISRRLFQPEFGILGTALLPEFEVHPGLSVDGADRSEGLAGPDLVARLDGDAGHTAVQRHVFSVLDEDALIVAGHHDDLTHFAVIHGLDRHAGPRGDRHAVVEGKLDILRTHRDETVQSQMRWIRNTREEAERMRELIEDLLFLAKSDANALKEQMSEVDLSDLSEDRALNFEAVAFEKGVTLESSIPPGLKVTGSESQLKQLLTILLDNAVKYAGPEGRVRIGLSPCQEKNGKNAVRIVVNNTGEAIPPEDLEHIFERFYRADKSRARKEGGYGLGLSIADSIVRRHRGRISCESTKKDGTTFTVTLPCT